MASRSRRSRLATAVALLAALGPAAGGWAKELHWKALEVDARLEPDGTLAISEVQRMIFTGEWNGGERKFRIDSGQRLTLDRLVRLGPDGEGGTELASGSLDELDHYDWSSGNTLRWRSRLPSDPPFDAAELVYRLDYRITGALRRIDDRTFQLNHEFAFTDRDGVIERLVVRLALSPEWRAARNLPVSWEAGPLAPGEGFILTTDFTYEGPGVPANAAPPRLASGPRLAGVAAFLVGAQAFLWATRRRDRALGRFAPLPRTEVDAAWLEEKVFALAPELVGAIWDRAVGSAEVAALLARMTQEGRLRTEVKVTGRFFRSENLHLELLCDPGELSEYESKLVAGLFAGAWVTDTESIRKRYRGTGFDPAAKIRPGVEASLKRVRGFADGSVKPNWRPTALLFFAGLGVLLLTAIGAAAGLLAIPTPSTIALGVFFVLALVVGSIPGWIGAFAGQGRVGSLAGPYFGLLLSQLAIAVAFWFLSGVPRAHPLHLAGGLLFALALVRSQANVLATRESAESLARRRELGLAREFFLAELAKPAPQLEDRWFPYLLAFGLAPKMDRWFRRFGAAGARGAGSYTSTASAASSGGGFSGGGSSGWSGGGGAFGGGGASATWAMAATAMSAGVSAPSSSSGGSSGGGGSSSSGGGGGGGW